jgi:hypothetical protein
MTMSRTVFYLERLGLVAMGGGVADAASDGASWRTFVFAALAVLFVLTPPKTREAKR